MTIGFPLPRNGAGLGEGQTAVVEPTRYTFAGSALLIQYADRKPSPRVPEQILDHPRWRAVSADAKRQSIPVTKEDISAAAIWLGVESACCFEPALGLPSKRFLVADFGVAPTGSTASHKTSSHRSNWAPGQ